MENYWTEGWSAKSHRVKQINRENCPIFNKHRVQCVKSIRFVCQKSIKCYRVRFFSSLHFSFWLSYTKSLLFNSTFMNFTSQNKLNRMKIWWHKQTNCSEKWWWWPSSPSLSPFTAMFLDVLCIVHSKYESVYPNQTNLGKVPRCIRPMCAEQGSTKINLFCSQEWVQTKFLFNFDFLTVDLDLSYWF